MEESNHQNIGEGGRMTIQDFIDDAEAGGFLVYCPGSDENISMQEYWNLWLQHVETKNHLEEHLDS